MTSPKTQLGFGKNMPNFMKFYYNQDLKKIIDLSCESGDNKIKKKLKVVK